MPRIKRDEPEGDELPGGDKSTAKWDDEKGTSFGEKFGDNLGFGREGEHVEPQSYGGPEPPRGTDYVDQYAPSEQADIILEAGPKTGLGPKNCGEPTGTLLDDVCVQLTQQGQLDASEIEVEVQEESRVILRGSVPNQEEKAIAERTARKIRGVLSVQNIYRSRNSNKVYPDYSPGASGGWVS